MKKNIIVSLILNSVIFLFVIFAGFCALFDYNFMTVGGAINFTPQFSTFKYFTTDSNFFLGIISAVTIGFEIAALAKKSYELPKAVYVFKLTATTGVTLTMLTTLFYLAPRDPLGYINKFLDSNFFFHLIVPLIALVSFLCFEKTNKLSKKAATIAILPVIIYTIYYAVNVFTHVENGIVSSEYDLYGFIDAGILVSIVVIPLMILASYFISVALWFINKKDL